MLCKVIEKNQNQHSVVRWKNVCYFRRKSSHHEICLFFIRTPGKTFYKPLIVLCTKIVMIRSYRELLHQNQISSAFCGARGVVLNLANKKLYALIRISKFVTQEKIKMLVRAFIESLFNYCPLVWMFHCRTTNNKMNKLHQRALIDL